MVVAIDGYPGLTKREVLHSRATTPFTSDEMIGGA